jgi:hypothetical protein
LDRECLENYEKKERLEYERLLRNIEAGKFVLGKDKYPPKERFHELQDPVTIPSFECATRGNLWAQIPFSGSLVLPIPPISSAEFEKFFFPISMITDVVNFIKETGRLQIILSATPLKYEGLDYLDPFLEELNPPCKFLVPLKILVDKRDLESARNIFDTVAAVRFLSYIREIASHTGEYEITYSNMLSKMESTFIILKTGHYAIAEDIENAMIDNPLAADLLLQLCYYFIASPFCDPSPSDVNFSFSELQLAQILPKAFQPNQLRFPCEIGKFLLRKLTYAPLGLDACKELIYHYDAYDLRKVQASFNEGIARNNPNILNKSSKALSEILDNIWNDKAIARKVKGLRAGILISMAAIGSVAAGPIGALGGFLAGIGYNVADRFIDLGTEGLSEKVAKLKTKSYQVNIYYFRSKYDK